MTRINNSLKIFFFIFLFFFKNSYAIPNEIGIYITGLSYHIGANDNNPANSNGPLALDRNGAFVFNPGIGITCDYFKLDFKERHTVALVPLAMIFGDCAFEPTYVFGLGPRYRLYFNQNFSFDFECFLSLFIAKDKELEKFTKTFVPFPSLGLNYHWSIISCGFKTTFAPRSGNSFAIGSFHILFSYLYFGIRF
jgi:hypothetical protein